MLKNVVFSSGIKRKQVVKIGEYKGIEIYDLKENQNKKYNDKYILHNNHLFPINWDIEEIKRFIDLYSDIEAKIVDWFERPLKEGHGVSLGLAKYLNREEEALKINKEVYEKLMAKRREKEEEKIRKKEELKKQREEQLDKAEEDFVNGNRINGIDFWDLCNRYELEIPIKTKGWIKRNLISIQKSEYGFSINYIKTLSSKIATYAKKIEKMVTDKELKHLSNKTA